MKLLKFKNKLFNDYVDDNLSLSEKWSTICEDLLDNNFQYCKIYSELILFFDILSFIDIDYSDNNSALFFSLVICPSNMLGQSNDYILNEILSIEEIDKNHITNFDLDKFRNILINANEILEKFIIEYLQKFIDNNMIVKE